MPLRKAGIVAVLCEIMWIFNEILSGKNWLNDYRKETFIQLEFNAQVCRLEYCLNYLFNNKQPGIEVIDSQADVADPFYIYLRDPQPASILMPVHLNATAEHIMLNDRAHNAEERVDFTVYVPDNISLDEEELDRFKSVVNNVKTPGKKWKLIHNA